MAISRQLETPSLEVGIISGQRAALLGVAFAFSETITAEFSDSQISLFKGGSVHVDQDPTGRKFTSKGSQQVMSDMLKKMKDGLDKTGEALGTLYLASPDGQSFVKMLTDPKNGKIIKDWAKVAMGEYVRDGAMSNS